MIFMIASVASVFKSALYIVIAILALMFMIVVHEFGHFLAGRILGFKINEFSIGFGPAIFKKKFKDDLQFSIRPIPLGGYCAFEGEDDERDKDIPGAFNNQAPWKRLIVLFSGAFFNFLSAVLILTIYFCVWGQPLTTIVGVYQGSPAAEAGFQTNDAILAVDGRMANVLLDTDSAFNYVDESGTSTFKVLRDGKVVYITATKGIYTVHDYSYTNNLAVYTVAENGSLELTEVLINGQYNYLGALYYIEDGEEVYYNPDNYVLKDLQQKQAEKGYALEKMAFYRYFDANGNNITYADALSLYNADAEYFVDNVVVCFTSDLTYAAASTITESENGGINTITVTVYTSEGVPSKIYADGNLLDINSLDSYVMDRAYTKSGFGINTGSYLNKLSFWRSISRAMPYTFYVVFKILASLGILFQPGGWQQAGGPITVITTISRVTQQGFYLLLWIVCILSANLAVMNLLPLPALDGSKMVFTTIEWIRGKPINRKVEAIIHTVGLILLFSLTIFLDVFQLAGGGIL